MIQLSVNEREHWATGHFAQGSMVGWKLEGGEVQWMQHQSRNVATYRKYCKVAKCWMIAVAMVEKVGYYTCWKWSTILVGHYRCRKWSTIVKSTGCEMVEE